MHAVGVVGFTRVHLKGRLVDSGLFVSALEVFGFIRGRWVHSRSNWRSMGSSEVVEFCRARPEGS